MAITADRALQLLTRVMDPEIPGLSIVDLGMVDSIKVDESGVHVDLIPTFMGCPALDLIRQRVQDALGDAPAVVRFVHTKPWTTQMVSAQGRAALTQWGIAPPTDSPAGVRCPLCGSPNTRRTSAFGSGLCRASFYCHDCAQPFEQMKSI